MKRSELKQLIFEAYVEHLREQSKKVPLKEDSDKDTSMVFGGTEGAELPDSTDQILAKFPTLKHALVRLHSEDYKEFVSGIDWVSPRPSVFRINLTNGQNYTLKWMGKDFEMTVLGKDYYLGTLASFQRALQKLTILYQEGPMKSGEESGGEGSDTFSGGSGGSGTFPGEDDFGGDSFSSEDGGDENSSEGENSSEDEDSQDLSKDSVDFEADSDE